MNPFNVLNVDRYVNQKEIVVAVARAMREKRYSAKEIAIAQKSLLDPVSRAAHSFLHNIDLSEDKAHLRREIMEDIDVSLHCVEPVTSNDGDDVSKRESSGKTGPEMLTYLEGIFD